MISVLSNLEFRIFKVLPFQTQNTEGSCLMRLLGPGKSCISQILGKFLANDGSNEINSIS